MSKIEQLLHTILENEILVKATLSNPLQKGPLLPSKAELRPVQAKGKQLFQLTTYQNNQAFHQNLNAKEAFTTILNELFPLFKQFIATTTTHSYHVLSNKKGDIKVISKPVSKSLPQLTHNREKQYILPEHEPLPFLIELGIANESGKILPQKMAKFRQINRFLEMVADIIPELAHLPHIHIVDFGCGKAYLTFALYHYLKIVKGLNVTISGIDLKKEVIEMCKHTAEKLGWDKLFFAVGNIAHFLPESPVDMVVALHACDTATDEALAKAIKWNAKVILAAPCCQHELYNQVNSLPLKPLLEHGILKERFAALLTDAARAKILEIIGYKTQVLEFIDSEHTPKNLMIRAIIGNGAAKRKKALEEYLEMKNCYSISPYLEKLCLQGKSKLDSV